MIRRALIIYCDNTNSGHLPGPVWDNYNIRNYLMSHIGGDWFETEIKSVRNPSSKDVILLVGSFLNKADYSFIVFSGHGYFSGSNMIQYLELYNGSFPINILKTNSPRQTIIIDACRGLVSLNENQQKGLSGFLPEPFIGDPMANTRYLFDRLILQADEGLTVLYSASINQTSLDTNLGGAYIISLFKMVDLWHQSDNIGCMLDLYRANELSKHYLKNFNTKQIPTLNREKRLRYFPLGVRNIS